MRRLLGAAILIAMSAYPAAQHFFEGATQSPVRVVIYEDLQCPDCADFRVMLDEKLLPRYASTVRFEHRDFPLAKHAWARKAAIAARFFEESKPGVGLAYRKYSLTNLREITADSFNDRLSQFAKDHGVDPAKAVASLDDARLAAIVEEDYQEGVARGIAHTPTVLVNGRPFVETFTVEDVAKAIDAELAASK
jgi:protein-disulfide isomerase